MFKLKLAVVFLSGMLGLLSISQVYADETAKQYIEGSSTTADIKAKLLADSDISSLKISVTTEKSVVTLTGCATTQEQIDKAGSIAKAVNGVTSVKNKLEICQAK